MHTELRKLCMMVGLLVAFAPCKPLYATPSYQHAKKSEDLPLGSHYLLLVNTAIARQLKTQDIAAFEKSPYDGLAVAFHYNYDTAPVFSSESMLSQLREWKKVTSKDLWPWIYFNRMIGAGEAVTNER